MASRTRAPPTNRPSGTPVLRAAGAGVAAVAVIVGDGDGHGQHTQDDHHPVVQREVDNPIEDVHVESPLLRLMFVTAATCSEIAAK